MVFKRFASKIVGVQFSKAEQRALIDAINQQIVEQDRQYEMDRDSSILWMLHQQFGFGPKKLYKAWKLMYADNKALQQKYEMSPDDGGWLCRRMLKDYGVDLEAWYKDEGLS